MFKKILIMLFLFFVSAGQIWAKDLKFAQIADVHYNLDETSNSKQSLKWAIDELNKMNDLDFVVFLGDNIEKSNKESLKSFLNIVNSLNKPYYLVLGNQDAHKISGITKDEYIDIVLNYNKNQKAFSSNYMFIPKKGMKCLVLDGVMPFMPSKHGQYTKETLEFAKNNLKKYKKDKFIIFQHFPIYEPFEEQALEIYEKDAYLELLKDFDNILLISSGHYHASKLTYDKKNVLHLSTESFAKEGHHFDIVEIKLKDRKTKKFEIDVKNIQLQ